MFTSFFMRPAMVFTAFLRCLCIIDLVPQEVKVNLASRMRVMVISVR